MHPLAFIALQHLVPQALLSRLIGGVASCKWGPVKNTFIDKFIAKYQVDMSLAEEENPHAYSSFNAFFTRALKPDARPIDPSPDSIVCPADGVISQLGAIQNGRIFQAKGRDYSLVELVGGDAELARPFHNGQFATVYLSPKDYHRVHLPLAGELTHMVHVPGQLFSVNTVTADNLPRLFARNERVVLHFNTAHGPMIVVLVGAMIVASIETPWAGLVAPLQRVVRTTQYGRAHSVNLAKGDEIGRFLLGSTAIVLLPEAVGIWDPTLTAGSPVQMGKAMGELRV